MRKKAIILIFMILTFTIIKINNVINISNSVNSYEIIKSIIGLEYSKAEIKIISEKNNTFLVKANFNFIEYMEKRGFDFIEQVGNIYVFEKECKKISIEGKKITKKYILLN